MENEIRFDYYYGEESEQFSFFRIPRILFKDARFSKLSSDAKLLYGLLLDRMSLSKASGWTDEDGRVYIIYTLREIQEDMCCGKDKAVKIMAELDCSKGIGLVERKRRGLGQPDILYVKNFIVKERTEPQGFDEEKSAEFKKSEKPNSRGRKNRTQEVGKTEFKDSDMPHSAGLDIRIQESGISELRNAENSDSRGRKIRTQEVGKTEPNYTKENYTEGNQTESIHPSIKPDTRDEMDGSDGSGPVEGYMALIRRNIEYEHYMSAGGISDRELVEELYQLICDIVCVRRESVRIGGEDYPYELVKSRFLKIRQPHIEYVMEAMKKTTSKIHDIRSYLITALYRAPDTMNHYYRQEVNHDFYGGEEKGIL